MKSVAEMTVDERQANSAKFEAGHRELWRWLAEHPEACQGAWPGWQRHSPLLGHCFACGARTDCRACPLCVSDEILHAMGLPQGGTSWKCLRGLYVAWQNSNCRERRVELATAIAELPWDWEKVNQVYPEVS